MVHFCFIAFGLKTARAPRRAVSLRHRKRCPLGFHQSWPARHKAGSSLPSASGEHATPRRWGAATRSPSFPPPSAVTPPVPSGHGLVSWQAWYATTSLLFAHKSANRGCSCPTAKSKNKTTTKKTILLLRGHQILFAKACWGVFGSSSSGLLSWIRFELALTGVRKGSASGHPPLPSPQESHPTASPHPV